MRRREEEYYLVVKAGDRVSVLLSSALRCATACTCDFNQELKENLSLRKQANRMFVVLYSPVFSFLKKFTYASAFLK